MQFSPSDFKKKYFSFIESVLVVQLNYSDHHWVVSFVPSPFLLNIEIFQKLRFIFILSSFDSKKINEKRNIIMAYVFHCHFEDVVSFLIRKIPIHRSFHENSLFRLIFL